MSVYSGFATRQQQNKYNTLLQTLIIALKKRIIKFYRNQECDQDKFKLVVKKIYKKMYVLEKGKFMTPKYTTCFTDLIDNLNIQINYDTLSETSSRISGNFSLHGGNSLTPLKNIQEPQQTPFKSRMILQNKKNLLQAKLKQNGLDSSMYSLAKKINTIQNQEQPTIRHNLFLQNKNTLQLRSNSVGINDHLLTSKNQLKSKKLRELKQLKQLRGTIHMPKVQDFLPKKQQIQPAFFHRPVIGSPQKQYKGGFRRQKYSRNDIQVQQI